MLRIVSPWVELYNKIKAIFADDLEIKIVFFDEIEVKTIKLFVADSNKAAALEKLLVPSYVFGNITVNIEVVPANDVLVSIDDDTPVDELYDIAFHDNPALVQVCVVRGILVFDVAYVIFRKEVVQYYNDDLSDAYGQCSTLYQEIAKEIFLPKAGIFFCTDKPDALDVPLGEWP